ncbi:DUF2023 family protein [Insolitispirillum peregrinum]|uniref:DUF2023 domain-containing protein n=1 Tax=Insolitispirillum peregrinum TaxID=80876 RepID=A0A1N7IHK1_9PROT|nr:DUF2023 family protein [Insolitispirillum peregrinum]SIS36584.1 Protein of unknown function [Insolitispirillum peregrinum]
MDQTVGVSAGCLGVLPQYLYEFHKGVRHLFMLTLCPGDAARAQARLEQDSIPCYLHAAGTSKTNLFFGRPACIETVRRIVTKPLCCLTPEEDFILGTLLGYDREQQCLRFLAMHQTGRPVAIRAAAH